MIVKRSRDVFSLENIFWKFLIAKKFKYVKTFLATLDISEKRVRTALGKNNMATVEGDI